jgi:hypothetical protein
MLILKRIYESRCVGPWPCEDFEVLDGNRCVGAFSASRMNRKGNPGCGVLRLLVSTHMIEATLRAVSKLSLL